jgi:hypothetical protein
VKFVNDFENPPRISANLPTNAVLTAGLVTHCVLGLSLANRLADLPGQGAVKQGAPAAGREKRGAKKA